MVYNYFAKWPKFNLPKTYSLIVEEILKSKVVQADETPLKYLKPKSGKAQQGYL